MQLVKEEEVLLCIARRESAANLVQPSLNCERSAEAIYDSALSCSEIKGRWDDLRAVEHPTNMQP